MHATYQTSFFLSSIFFPGVWIWDLRILFVCLQRLGLSPCYHPSGARLVKRNWQHDIVDDTFEGENAACIFCTILVVNFYKYHCFNVKKHNYYSPCCQTDPCTSHSYFNVWMVNYSVAPRVNRLNQTLAINLVQFCLSNV